ncbi:transcriptional repressor LexA [Ferroacidibacillus organovorans]|uniref:LexA repressor n=1 Tax=Ferroacidibacillus organovorans TaxID=1765683 RepID=A0A161PX39_9BACL|nr:transcriptional repressor LexA [Ferroacidibacillus organovorans]KYP80355.1 repressor LexA [Ferroacidibacillus organovorans]OAG93337.1 XRE family transcriptional regulator [Ferroacidibacillus organovorans]OPG16499.1 repressor LexA [Ferroacidibacillus organovorans]
MTRINGLRKQDEILIYLKQVVSKRGYPPSVREIGEAMGLSSTSTVHAHLAKLEDRGLIKRDPTKPRAIEIVDETSVPIVGVPLVGRVTAGLPITAIEEVEDYLPIPPYHRTASELFALRVSGESMVDAGILDGDLVYVKRQQTADNGDIVVAMSDEGEATVKRFFKEQERIRLQPENATMQPLFFNQVTILGKVIGLYRNLF